MFLDSHCHLEMENFDRDRDAVVAKAIEEGLAVMLTVGTEERYFQRVRTIVERYQEVYGALGVHPHNAADFTDRTEGSLLSALRHPKIVALGEIGLDFFKNYSPHDAQRRVFRRQLGLAKDAGLPVIIHSRSAKEETLSIVGEVGPPERGGIIHCYSYDVDGARRFLDLGFHISIPGTVTYGNNGNLTDVVAFVPADRLLAETDAPFLTPNPMRGKRNEPRFVTLTIERVAAIRKRPAEEVAEAMYRNFCRLFLGDNRGGVS